MKSTAFDALGKEHTLMAGPDEIVTDGQIGISKRGINRSLVLILLVIVAIAFAGAFFYQKFVGNHQPPAAFLEQPVEPVPSQVVESVIPGIVTSTPITPATDLGPAGIALQELQQQAIPVVDHSNTVQATSEALPAVIPSVVHTNELQLQAPVADVVKPAQEEPVVAIKPVAAKPKAKPSSKPKPKPVASVPESAQELEEPVTSERILIFSE